MKAKVKKVLLANLVSMGAQVTLLGLLSLCGLDTWLAISISKGCSWCLFGFQLVVVK
jgi:hypothetical protein